MEKDLGLDIKPRLSDFKAIEAAILKNKAYEELQPLADYANKKYPKAILGTYHQALYPPIRCAGCAGASWQTPPHLAPR